MVDYVSTLPTAVQQNRWFSIAKEFVYLWTCWYCSYTVPLL